MNSLDTHILRAIRAYPDQHEHRSDVLVWMFLVCGNGCKWENGRLVCESPLVPWSFERAKEFRKKWGFPAPKEDCPKIRHRAKVASEAHARSKDDHPPRRILSLPSIMNDYVPLFLLPEDVQDDYLQGALEVIQILEASPTNYAPVTHRAKEHLKKTVPGRLPKNFE